MLQRGTRLVLKHLSTKDSLRGTELLLTAAGRATLTAHYAEQFQGQKGPVAFVSGTDWSVGSLDAESFFDDYSRENDISYYEVNEPDQTLKITQPSGYAHCIPRELVSTGEKRLFAETLLTLDLECLRAGRGNNDGLLGLRVDVDDHVEQYLKAGAASEVDFFAATVDSVDKARLAVETLEANRSRMVLGTHVDLKGIRHDDEDESLQGFDTPVVLRLSPGVDLGQILEIARTAVDGVVAGVVAPAPLAPEEATKLAANCGCVLLSPTTDGAAAEVVHAP